VDLLHAQIALTSMRGDDAPALLLKAAKQLEPLDVQLARDTYMEAFTAAIFAGRSASPSVFRDLAEAVRAAASSPRPHPSDLLLEGLALVFTDGYAVAAPMLTRALSAFHSEPVSMAEELRSLWCACRAAIYLWDDETYHALASRAVRLAREAGALSVLPMTLSALNGVLLLAGEFAEVAAQIEEAEALTDPTGGRLALYSALPLAAWRGREGEVSELIEATKKQVVARGEGIAVGAIQWASGVLYNGLGRYEEAQNGVARAVASPAENAFWTLPELVEASTRTGDTEAAADAVAQLSEMTQAGGNDWGLAIEARSRALLAAGPAAEDLYREAIERLGRTRIRVLELDREVDDPRAHDRGGGHRAAAPSWPAPISSMASGSGASAAASTRASSSAALTRSSARSGCRRSPSAPASSWRRPASAPASARPRPATT
jgi:tetratricopeptide (TPR) repeat protein